MMITAFLPCRAGSERIPNKNTKPFSGIQGGLLRIKLEQLMRTPMIDKVVLSTNDQDVISIARSLDKKIIIDLRPENLASSTTSTDDLIKYVPSIIKEGHVIWTHVTSPFLDNKDYQLIIKKYLETIAQNKFDSLMTVNKVQTFLWNKERSINYDRKKEKWPRTQTLPEIFEVNSGVFINSIENYSMYNDRIGNKPFLYKTIGYSSFDIDWPEDFDLAELIYKSLNS